MNNVHGGDIVGHVLQYGGHPIDFSASLNPLGMPKEVKQAAVAAIGHSYAYPDPYVRKLTVALAEKLSIEPAQLLLGNGSAGLIYRYVQAVRPQRALLPVLSFAEYERALRAVGCEVRHHGLDSGKAFDVDDSILPEITPDIDVLFLCQPGNPTGRVIDVELLDRILDKCQEMGTLLFLDECFVPFVRGAKKISRVCRLASHPNLFILGSFTKLYGMAGIRLGYGLCGNTSLLEKMIETL